MPWGHRIAISSETLKRLKKLMERLNIDTPNQAIIYLLNYYESNASEVAVPVPACPYCQAIAFQTTAQLRKHIVKKHVDDFLQDYKKHG